MGCGGTSLASVAQARTCCRATDAIVAVVNVVIAIALYATVLRTGYFGLRILICKHFVPVRRQLLLGQRGSADSAGNTEIYPQKVNNRRKICCIINVTSREDYGR